MSGAHSCDAIVVGGGVNGLAAAGYLAMAGKRVLVVEARSALGGRAATTTLANGCLVSRAAHLLYALDPHVVRELKLSRHGLRFAIRDMALAGLRADGKHLVISRDAIASARAIAVHSESDAAAWSRFSREWYGLARALRALWWRAGRAENSVIAEDPRVQGLARMGVKAWLDTQFESEALKALLGFDSHAVSPLAAGSALVLFWRAAQEMCGLQGAVAMPRGGLRTVADAFAGAARSVGAEMRCDARVVDILVDAAGAAAGVMLASGETIAAPLVLSSLSRRRTLAFAGVRDRLDFGERALLERERIGPTMARVTLVLGKPPTIAGTAVPANARFVVMDRLESLAAAHAAAYAGRLPQELTMEAILPDAIDPTLAPSGHHLVSVLVGPVPVAIDGGWAAARPLLAARVVGALSRHMPGLSTALSAIDIATPDDTDGGVDDAFGGSVDVRRLLSDWRARVTTPVDGLVLCGAAADPVGAVSGRGGRVAAALVFERESKR